MRRGLPFLLAAMSVAAALGLGSLGGCDDDNGNETAKTAKHATTNAAARLGIDWRNVSEARISAWGFTTRPDGLDEIRDALESGMLPPRTSVKIAGLVARFATGLPQPEPGDPAFRPTIVLTTTPWNDDTLLLLVGLAGADSPPAMIPRDLAQTPDRPAVTVEFDPKNVAAYRLLGDPATLPIASGGAKSVAVLYELSPLREPVAGGRSRYAMLHVRYRLADALDSTVHEVEQPITDGDFVETVDDAPDMVRFAAAVAGFGSLLRGDPAVRDLSCNEVISLAQSAAAPDPDGARAQLIQLMRRAEPLIDLPTSDSPTVGDAH